MIRTFTIVAAVFALLLPAGRYIDDALGTGVKSGYASGVTATRAGGEVLPGDFAKSNPNGIIAILIG